MSSQPRLTEKVTRTVVRTLGLLPERAQRVLAGAPVEVDGQRLFTEVQMALRLLNALPGSSFERLPLPAARAQIDAEARMFGTAHPVDVVEDVVIAGPGGPLRLRRYVADGTVRPTGTLVYFHGGGWVVGSLESADSVCRFLARRSGAQVLSVEYRLAPEEPFPAAVDDAVAAFRWVRDHRDRWDLDDRGVAVAGDSAGGNLSAVTAQLTRDDPAGGPDFQLLFFPVTDLSTKHRSYTLFPDGYFLTEAQMDWYRGHYLPDGADADLPTTSPLLADDLSGLAPAYVAVSGFDVLRDEGLAYAERLTKAGVPTQVDVQRGHIHGWVNSTGVGSTSTAALATAADALRLALVRAARTR